MAWMNEYEIDDCVDQLRGSNPQAYAFAKFLSDWRDIVNANSDGWAHWRSGTKSADRLSGLVHQAVDALRGVGTAPSVHAFRAALPPIKATATRHKLPFPDVVVVADILDEPAGPRPGR